MFGRFKKFDNSGVARIETIIECSKVYDDLIHTVLAVKLTDDPSLTIMCHRNCMSTYTSRQQVKRFLKRRVMWKMNVPPKRGRSSCNSIF